MKISQVVVLSLSVASAHALAFQPKERAVAAPTAQQLKAAENVLVINFYNPHLAGVQAAAWQSCAAVPVPGCGCPFCTQLRSRA